MAIRFSRTGNILTVVIAGIALVSMGAASFSSSSLWSSHHRRRATPGRNEVIATMTQLGLDPDALAASGVTSDQVPPLFTDLGTAMASAETGLIAADAACMSSQQSQTSLENDVRAGKRGAETLASLQSAKTAAAAAISARDTLLESEFVAATASLNEGQIATLRAIRRNRHWLTPMEYAVVDRTEAQWVALKDALAGEQIAAARGVSPSGAAHDLMMSASSVDAVSTAKTRLQTNGAAVKNAWMDALGQ
jgi:hypothetical protein